MDIYLFEDFVDLEEAVNIQIFVPVSCLHVLSDSLWLGKRRSRQTCTELLKKSKFALEFTSNYIEHVEIFFYTVEEN